MCWHISYLTTTLLGQFQTLVRHPATDTWMDKQLNSLQPISPRHPRLWRVSLYYKKRVDLREQVWYDLQCIHIHQRCRTDPSNHDDLWRTIACGWVFLAFQRWTLVWLLHRISLGGLFGQFRTPTTKDLNTIPAAL